MNKMFNVIKEQGKKAALVVGATVAPVAAFAQGIGTQAATEISGGKAELTSAGGAMVGLGAVFCVIIMILCLVKR